MRLPRILVFPGSNRSGSLNARLAGTIVKALSRLECEVTRISLRDYDLPVFDADLEAERGAPENALKLARLFHEHDAVVLVSPEYNTSLPPLVKNTIDWISRVRADARGELQPYRGKVFAISAASPGTYGGIRCLITLRTILSTLGALVVSEQVSVSRAAGAFDEMDELKDEQTAARLDAMCRSIVEKANLLSVRMED